MDVISILRKMQQDVTSYDIRAQGERPDTHPNVFTSIRIDHTVRGRNLKVASIHRAIELSETKYCAVGGMLRPTVPVTVHYQVIDEETGTTTEGQIGLPAPV
jgi:putative redox protein